MAQITITVPDELSEQLQQLGDKLPELLQLSLQQPALPAHIYCYILNFLASNPTSAEIVDFRPTPAMQARLKTLISRSHAGSLTPSERQELHEYERIEHLVILMKSGFLPYLSASVTKALT